MLRCCFCIMRTEVAALRQLAPMHSSFVGMRRVRGPLLLHKPEGSSQQTATSGRDALAAVCQLVWSPGPDSTIMP